MREAERELPGRSQAGRFEGGEDPLFSLGDRRPMPLTRSGSSTKSWIVCFG